MTTRFGKDPRNLDTEKRDFDRALKLAVEAGLSTDMLEVVSPYVRSKVNDVAEQFPNTNPESIQLARNAFDDYRASRRG
jgi:hypothetical protein